MSEQPGDHALSFDRAAEVYERARPGYPAASVDWMVPTAARRVLDLGSGTGKLTRALVDRGLDCIAVDPAPRMLARLRDALPGVATLVGAAERIPLPDGDVDAVLVAQAWHWVDPVRAVPEVARVLRLGGALGLVWNIRDERVDWVAELGRIVHDGGSSAVVETPPEPGAPFDPVERHVVEWRQPLDRAGLHELVESRSYFITADDEDRRRIRDAVDALLDEHPDLAGRDAFELPYRTFSFRARLA